MKTPDVKKLVLNYFSNNITPLQKEYIDQWLALEKNEDLYYSWLLEWESSMPEYFPELEIRLKEYQIFMQKTPHDEIREETTLPFLINDNVAKQHKIVHYKIIGIAASIIICLSIVLSYQSILYKTYDTSLGETKTIVLDDNSIVILNANSSLKEDRWSFLKQNREIFLKGSARFSVFHTVKNKKFIVKTDNNFEVVVLGTEFSVLSRNKKSRITLDKGKVQINYFEKNKLATLLMKPGELVTLGKVDNIKIIENIKTPKFDLKENRIIFQETSLSEVAIMLEETYGVQVVIENQVLANKKLTGTFKAESLKDFLQLIKEVFNIEIEQKGMIYFLK